MNESNVQLRPCVNLVRRTRSSFASKCALHITQSPRCSTKEVTGGPPAFVESILKFQIRRGGSHNASPVNFQCTETKLRNKMNCHCWPTIYIVHLCPFLADLVKHVSQFTEQIRKRQPNFFLSLSTQYGDENLDGCNGYPEKRVLMVLPLCTSGHFQTILFLCGTKYSLSGSVEYHVCEVWGF